MVLVLFTIVVGNGVPIQKFQDFFHLSKRQIIDLPKIKKLPSIRIMKFSPSILHFLFGSTF